MTAQDHAAGDGPGACPFVALIDDRDRRAAEPDSRHRCFAEAEPAPRASAHQAHYCLSPAFPACPTFQDWARREAARVVGGAAAGAADAPAVPAPVEPVAAHPVEPKEEAARPASRAVGLWGAVAAGGSEGPPAGGGAEGPPVAGGAEELPAPAPPPLPVDEIAAEAEPEPIAESGSQPGAEPREGFAAEITAAGLAAAAVSRQPDDATAPVEVPPFLAGRSGPPSEADSIDQAIPGAQPARRLRPDDAGWSSQSEIRRNLPPDSSAPAVDSAARLRPAETDTRATEYPPVPPSVPPATPDADVGPAPAPEEPPLPIYERLAAASAPPPPLDPEATAVELAAFLRRRAEGGEGAGGRPTAYPATPMTGAVPPSGAPGRTAAGSARTVAAGGVLAGAPPSPGPGAGERYGPPTSAGDVGPAAGVGPVYEARPGTGVVPSGGVPAGYPSEWTGYGWGPAGSPQQAPGSPPPQAYPPPPGYPRPSTQPPGGGPPVPVMGPQARPAIAGARPRIARDPNAPPWEPPSRHEAYPTISRRVGLPRIPRALILAVALLVAALLIFLAPSFFAGGGASPTPSASRTPGATASATGSAAPTESTPAPAGTTEPTVYTVVANDTISGIAAKFGVTVEALLAANPQIKDPNTIAVGDEITIPPKASATPKPTPKPTPEPT